MKEKRLLKKVWRYHRISHKERLESIISLYKDCLYIKVDIIYEDIKARDTYYESYISSYERFAGIKEQLSFGNISEKLIAKIIKVLILWQLDGLIKFSRDGIIVINGGQINDNQ